MIRFCLHPGWVISKHDWERHFIAAGDLVYHYRVSPRECVVWNEPYGVVGYSRQHLARLLHLYPLSGPDYRPVSDRERLMYPLPEPSRATERAMGRLTLMEHLLRAVEGPTEPQAEPEEPALEFLYYR